MSFGPRTESRKERMAESGSRVIPANEYRRVRWKNCLGWTREIVRARVRDDADCIDADDWDVRLSIAEVERKAAFSLYPGIDRELVLLRGNGLRLHFTDGEMRELSHPGERLRFAGERALDGEPIDGPTHDFNLMWRRDLLQAELHHRPLVGSMLFFTAPGTTWAIHLMSGRARFDADSALPPLEAGDTAMLIDHDARRRYRLEGAGELLSICLTVR